VGPGAVAPALFEHGEERADELGVEQRDVDAAGRTPVCSCT